ncbi:MAG: BspA family leucine-rich repeat surface protein, partial [Treponema sp.]|nr:BspA family leucine-rich repeat surface protein [Treponema sp.]
MGHNGKKSLKQASRLFAGALVCAALLFTGCAQPSGGGSGGGSAPAIEMKTGPEIQTELQKIGYKTATSFEASATGPSFSILSNPNAVVILSENCTIDEYIDRLLNGEKPAVCIAWKDGDTIYYFANGYTDKGKKIPLNPDSSKMFSAGSSIPMAHIDLGGFDTSNVTNMSEMFKYLQNVTTLDLSGFNTAKVTDMSNMFNSMEIKTLDLSSFNVKSLTNTKSMFASNDYLERIYVKAGTDWNISANVTNSETMFYYCLSLKGGNNFTYNGGRDIAYARIAGLNGIEKGYFTDVKTKGVLQRIELNTTNVKKEYFKGTTLDTTGLSITAYFKDSYGTESTTTVVAGYETSYDFSSTGQKEVTVSYTKDGITKSASYTVTVMDGHKVTVKHMQQNLADNNYTVFEEEEFGLDPNASFTPTVKSYEGFTKPAVSALTINEDKTIELKYSRTIVTFTFAAVAEDGTRLQYDSSYKTNISSITGVTSVTFQTLNDSSLPLLTIKAKCGTDLSNLKNYIKAKGYKFVSINPINYTDDSNLENGFYKKVKENMNNIGCILNWRLPVLYMCDQNHGNNLSNYLNDLGANKSATKFIPSKTPMPAGLASSQYNEISLRELPPDYRTHTEVLAYAWVEMVGSSLVIKYYAEYGNASNADGYPTLPYTDCRYMFTGCKNLQEIDLTGFDLSGATNMSYVFNNCTALKTIKFGKINTANVTTMRELFMQCTNLTSVNLPNNFVRSKCTDLNCMFEGCEKLTSVNTTGW